MKYTIISERSFTGKTSLLNKHWPFDITLQYGLDAYHIPVSQIIYAKNFGDICIIIPSKKNGFPKKWINFIRKRSPNTKLCIMQEGSSFEWQDKSLDYIDAYIEAFKSGDCILAHTDRDVRFYKAFHNKVMRVPTCINLETLKPHRIDNWREKENKILVKGNLASKFNLPFQLELARVTNYEIFIPTIKANHPRDFEILKGVAQLPYFPYNKWNPVLSRFKIITNIINGVAAGQQCLTGAALGIPVISTNRLNTANDVFPELAIDPYDFEKGSDIILKLINDKTFYEDIRKKGLERVKQYDYKIVCPKFKKELETLLK